MSSSPVYASVLTESPQIISDLTLPAGVVPYDVEPLSPLTPLTPALTFASTASSPANSPVISPYQAPSIDGNQSLTSLDAHHSEDGWTLSQDIDERRKRRDEELSQKMDQVQVEDDKNKKTLDSLLLLLKDNAYDKHRRYSLQVPINTYGDIGEPVIAPSSASVISLPEAAGDNAYARIDDDDFNMSDETPSYLISTPPPSPTYPTLNLPPSTWALSDMELNSRLSSMPPPPGLKRREDTPFPHDLLLTGPTPMALDPRDPVRREELTLPPVKTTVHKPAPNYLPAPIEWNDHTTAGWTKVTAKKPKITKRSEKEKDDKRRDGYVNFGVYNAAAPKGPCTDKQIDAYTSILPPRVLSRILAHRGRYDNGRYICASNTGRAAYKLRASFAHPSVKVVLRIAHALARSGHYQSICTGRAPEVPGYENYYYREDDDWRFIQYRMRELGIEYREVDRVMGATIAFLKWAIASSLPTITPEIRQDCRESLKIAYKRSNKIAEFPEGWKSYREALLDRILAKYSNEVKSMPYFSAYDFKDIAEAYTREDYAKEYPSSYVA